MSNSNEPGAPRAPLKRHRTQRNNHSNENEPGAPRRKLVFSASFLEDDEDASRERAINRIVREGEIGNHVEGFYQAQGVTELYQISGPTNEQPEKHLKHIKRINVRGGSRKRTLRKLALRKRTLRKKRSLRPHRV